MYKIVIIILGLCLSFITAYNVSNEENCEMSCNLYEQKNHHCQCLVNGTTWCNQRNLTEVPKFPECTTMIFLQRNDIEEIGQMDFVNASQVVFLDLAQNRLKALNKGIFDHLTELQVLILHGNKIATVNGEVFRTLKNLMTLDLSRNKISTLPSIVFDGNPVLDLLSLHENYLTKLEARWFESSTKWRYVYLSKNPWNCSCSLFESYQRVFNSTQLQSQCNSSINDMPKSMCIICYEPLHNKSTPLDMMGDKFPPCQMLPPTTVGIKDQGVTTRMPSLSEGKNFSSVPATAKLLPSQTSIVSTAAAKYSWTIYIIILLVFITLIGILGIAMWRGEVKEKKLKAITQKSRASILQSTRRARKSVNFKTAHLEFNIPKELDT